jgi:hypothetical protein
VAFWGRGFRRSLILSGEVVVIRLTIETVEPEANDRLWSIASHDSYRLREEIAAAVHEHMGPEFDVRSMSFARGSLELLVVVGTLYYAVSRYKNFVESIELLIAQLKRVTAGFFGPPRMLGPVSVQGSWTPGPGLVQAAPRMFDALMGECSGLVVWYLVLSHAAMLAVLLWLLARGLRP